MVRSSVIALGGVIAFAGCVRHHDVAVDLVPDPTVATASPASYTVRVYHGSRCPTLQQLALDADAALDPVASTTFAAGGSAAPIGELGAGTYAFAALARSRSCTPFALGCVTLALGSSSRVRIPLHGLPWQGGAAPCPDALNCQEGLCKASASAGPDACSATAGCVPACDRCGLDAGCLDLTSDPDHCGSCGHACPTTLACQSSLCRPSPPPTRFTLAVRPLDGQPPGGGPYLLGVVWLPLLGTSGVEPGWVETVDLSSGADAPQISLSVAPLSSPAASTNRCSCGFADSGIAVGQIVIVRDANGDGVIQDAEVRTPSELAVAQLLIIDSPEELGPNDGRLAMVSSFLALPEGVMAGFGLYTLTTPPSGPPVAVPMADADSPIEMDGCFAATTGTSAAAGCLAEPHLFASPG